ncbi:MAG: hypothetical protein AAFO07_26220, partial [Bacteroidota bacterium]
MVIYMYKGKNDVLLNENMPSLLGSRIELYVCRNEDQSLGFLSKKLGITFTKELITGKNFISILFPEIICIQKPEEVEKRDRFGQLLWNVFYSGSLAIEDLETNAAGDVFLFGRYLGTPDVDPGPGEFRLPQSPFPG